MLTCQVAAGPYSFAKRYRSDVAARAWLASGSLPGDGAGPGASGSSGFDRPYAGTRPTSDLPAQRGFDADAYRGGLAEHDRLCRELIDQRR